MYKGLTLERHVMDVLEQFGEIPHNALLKVLQYEQILPMKDTDAYWILKPQLDKLIKQKRLEKFKSLRRGSFYKLA